MIVDAHHHLWRYNPVEYAWIGEELNVLRRDFLVADIKAQIETSGVDGVVTVQARQTIEETEWLLHLAEENDFIRGVVGWAPLVSPTIGEILGAFVETGKLKAIRHVLQDEPDNQMMLSPRFGAGISALRRFDLAYDILIVERQLPQAIRFVDRHPDQVFVLDHAAKPRIHENVLSPWRENILTLAERPNVYCKLSGMVTEADLQAWTEAQLRPYMDVVLEAFGPARIMFGSDWPVCLAACLYQRWYRIVSDFISTLSAAEQARVMGATAAEAYKL